MLRRVTLVRTDVSEVFLHSVRRLLITANVVPSSVQVESSCERGNEPSGSIKCWELPNGCTTCGLSCGTQLHGVSCS
jgi:hypothetical protein